MSRIPLMNQLLVSLFAGTGMFAILCLCCILLGRLQAGGDALLQFGVSPCEGAVCLRGIRAGVTNWTDIEAGLPYPQGSINDEGVRLEQGTYQVMYWRGGDDKTHFQINAIDAPLLALGELIASVGDPCSLTMASDRLYVQYTGFAAEISIPRDVDLMRRTFLNPRSPVTSLLFFDDPPCDTPLVFVSSRNIYVRWCGFATLGQYIDQCRLPGLILLPE